MNDDAMNNVANLIGECKNCFTMGHGSILYTPSKATLDTGFCRLIVLTAGSVCQLRHTTSTWMLGLADLNVTCSLHAMPNLQFPSMEGKTVTKGITLHPWSTEVLDWRAIAACAGERYMAIKEDLFTNSTQTKKKATSSKKLPNALLAEFIELRANNERKIPMNFMGEAQYDKDGYVKVDKLLATVKDYVSYLNTPGISSEQEEEQPNLITQVLSIVGTESEWYFLANALCSNDYYMDWILARLLRRGQLDRIGGNIISEFMTYVFSEEMIYRSNWKREIPRVVSIAFSQGFRSYCCRVLFVLQTVYEQHEHVKKCKGKEQTTSYIRYGTEISKEDIAFGTLLQKMLNGFTQNINVPYAYNVLRNLPKDMAGKMIEDDQGKINWDNFEMLIKMTGHEYVKHLLVDAVDKSKTFTSFRDAMGGEANPNQFNNKELALPHSIEKHGYAALYKSKEHLYESGAGAIHHTTSLFEAALDRFTKDVVPLFTKKKQAQFREQTKALKFNDLLVHINQEAIALSRAAWESSQEGGTLNPDQFAMLSKQERTGELVTAGVPKLASEYLLREYVSRKLISIPGCDVNAFNDGVPLNHLTDELGYEIDVENRILDISDLRLLYKLSKTQYPSYIRSAKHYAYPLLQEIVPQHKNYNDLEVTTKLCGIFGALQLMKIMALADINPTVKQQLTIPTECIPGCCKQDSKTKIEEVLAFITSKAVQIKDLQRYPLQFRNEKLLNILCSNTEGTEPPNNCAIFFAMFKHCDELNKSYFKAEEAIKLYMSTSATKKPRETVSSRRKLVEKKSKKDFKQKKETEKKERKRQRDMETEDFEKRKRSRLQDIETEDEAE